LDLQQQLFRLFYSCTSVPAGGIQKERLISVFITTAQGEAAKKEAG